MGGIAGFAGFKNDFSADEGNFKNILSKMSSAVAHRGMDEEITVVKKNIGFSGRNLLTSLKNKASNPFIKKFGEAECVLLYDGEVYNVPELKKELELEGAKFITPSDSEVLMEGIYNHGTEFIKKINGNFAIAFWNGKDNHLLLIRDRVGIKPLFYTMKESNMIFGSEIKAVLSFPGIEAKIDIEGLREIFGLGPARTAGIGVFKNIEEVKPGYMLLFSIDNVKSIQYWDIESKPHKDSYEETVSKVRELILESVKTQSEADAPVCSFLSGGVDSSVVTAIAAKHLRESRGQRLKTFSFDFTENDKYFKSSAFQPDQDRPWAEKVVQYWDTDHTFLECNYEELADYLYKAVDAKDLPGMADIDASLLYFCEKIGKEYKVALTGETADEIFGGYPWFHKKEMFEKEAFPWSSNLETRELLIKDELIEKLNLAEYADKSYRKTIQEVPALEGENPEEKRRRELAYLNTKWFMSTLIDRMDRVSMYSGLSARVPFADFRIIEYVFNVPWEIKCKDNMVKHLLRKSCEGMLPDELLYRKKSPYPKTYHPAYEALLSKRLKEIIADKNEPLHNLLDAKKADMFLSQASDYGKPWFGQLMAGPQLTAYMLQINYWLKKYKIALV